MQCSRSDLKISIQAPIRSKLTKLSTVLFLSFFCEYPNYTYKWCSLLISHSLFPCMSGYSDWKTVKILWKGSWEIEDHIYFCKRLTTDAYTISLLSLSNFNCVFPLQILSIAFACYVYIHDWRLFKYTP